MRTVFGIYLLHQSGDTEIKTTARLRYGEAVVPWLNDRPRVKRTRRLRQDTKRSRARGSKGKNSCIVEIWIAALFRGSSETLRLILQFHNAVYQLRFTFSAASIEALMKEACLWCFHTSTSRKIWNGLSVIWKWNNSVFNYCCHINVPLSNWHLVTSWWVHNFNYESFWQTTVM